ncbi:MAG: 4Fe-4S binding protein [archaeon]|nr:4Fe-4S binding protein [archaeon]
MIFQNEILPFDPLFAIPMLFFWLETFLMCIMIIDMKMMSKKVRTTIYILILFFEAVLLGGIPNVVMPIQEIFLAIGLRSDLLYLGPLTIILGILLITSFFVGRIFCGFSCPLGILQELISKISFKSDLIAQKDVKYRIDVSSKLTKRVRWIFFSFLFILTGVFGISILPLFNPLSGFTFFSILKYALGVTYLVHFIILIVVCIASIFLYRPWCRFLCPFGACSSVGARFTRVKYQRTEDCNDCGLCEKVCPTQEAFANSKKEECYYCNRCIDICPKDAIKFDKI